MLPGVTDSSSARSLHGLIVWKHREAAKGIGGLCVHACVRVYVRVCVRVFGPAHCSELAMT